MNSSNKTLKLTIPIGELFKLLDIDNNWYDAVQIPNRNIGIKSPNGSYVKINGFVKKQGNVREYIGESGTKIKCDEKHLIKQIDGSFNFINDSDHFIENGIPVKIKGKGKSTFTDVYDISLDFPHEYVTSSGIICHNTSAAKILANSLDSDVMYINASDENSVDTVRDRIKTFASANSFKRWKIIILDEFSYFTPNAQSALNAIMETFSKSTRFILTCNYVEKVLPSIQSRCTCFHLESPSKPLIAKRIVHILKTEGITFKPEDVATMVNRNYPDQRSIINEVQRAAITGSLIVPTSTALNSDSYMSKLLDVLLETKKSKKETFTSCRQIIADSKVRTFEDLYRFLYDNSEKLSLTNQAALILEISTYAQRDTQVLDKEINAMALLIQIINLIKS